MTGHLAAYRTAFLTRAHLGLPAPRSISRNIAPSRGGVALHHGGDNVPIRTHADCIATWRGWHRFHTIDRGWVDIAYTLGVCQHGYVFAGRGIGIRTAANGTNDGNLRFYAIVWIGGSRQTPTPEALAAITWAVHELRTAGGAGLRVVRHKFLNPTTACPHPAIGQHADALDRRTIDLDYLAPQPTTPAPEDDMPTLDQIADAVTRPILARLASLGGQLGDHHQRANEISRVADAALAAAVGRLRADLGMDPSPESDLKHVEYVRQGRAGSPYTWENIVDRLVVAAMASEPSSVPTDPIGGAPDSILPTG